jgi:hypothetical protein
VEELGGGPVLAGQGEEVGDQTAALLSQHGDIVLHPEPARLAHVHSLEQHKRAEEETGLSP